ncbi:uncharacterized protein LOC110745609, partial [Prunus avium]|uniref:Uncharacterized protein LOC110745609 n=1 Tax=Prunus avium TaxID=42229 RepID=A0A6P5RKN0_PRUAV
MVDSTVGGSLMDKTADEAVSAFETICENSEHWDFPTKDTRVAPTSSTQKGGIYEVSASTSLEAQVAALTKLLTPLVQKEMLSQLLKKSDRYEQEVASLKQSQSVLEKSQSKFEVQLGQIATTLNRLERTQGQFPSQTEANPRNHDQVQAITTLRSGKVIDNKIGNSEITDKEEDEVVTKPGQQLDQQSEDSLKSDSHAESVNHTLPTQNADTHGPLPFPQRSRQVRNNKYKGDIMEQFKKVQINIPLLEAIKQIPSYAKFLKDICTNKRRFEEHEKVMLSDNVSAVLQRKLPPKLQDPGSFTIPCTIGERKFDKALLDLGASVNLMPYSVYEHLGLGELKHISISLQFADRSVKYPRGIVEDVLIHVDQFILPADFVVLDMEEAEISGRELPLILGRPFMATVGTKIDVKSGLLTMTVQDITVKFQVFEALKRPIDPYDCFHVEVMDCIIEKTFIESSLKDPLEICISQHGMSFEKATILAAEEDLNA